MSKILCFDIDNVICKTKKNNYKNSKPNKRAIKKINQLYDQGYIIKIFTSRYMGRNNENVSKAKKNLSVGEILDGEGGYASKGKLVTSKKSIENNFLPLGLSDGAKTKRPIKKDEYIKIDDVEINWKQEVLKARKYQINLLNS